MAKSKDYKGLGAYFTAAPGKLAVMSVCTFGLYQWVWFIRNWRAYRVRTGRWVMPTWQTLFAPVLSLGLFTNIAVTADENGLDPGWPPPILALVFFVLWFVHLMPGHWNLLALANVVPVLLANNVARAVNAKLYPQVPENDRLSAGNVIVILFGSAILFLILYFEFFPLDLGGGDATEQLQELQAIREMLG
jgi:hypothetical protein